MKIESVLRSINRRMQELNAAFGYSSLEYQWASSMWWSVAKSSTVPIGTKKNGILLFRRGKDVMQEIWENPELEVNLREMWNKMKEKGTVKQILEREYFNQQGTKEWMEENDFTVNDLMNDPDVMADVREEAAIRGDKVYNDDDIYVDVNTALDEADSMEDIQELGDIMGSFYETGGGLAKDEKWDKIKRQWRDYKYRKERESSMKADETEPK